MVENMDERKTEETKATENNVPVEPVNEIIKEVKQPTKTQVNVNNLRINTNWKQQQMTQKKRASLPLETTYQLRQRGHGARAFNVKDKMVRRYGYGTPDGFVRKKNNNNNNHRSSIVQPIGEYQMTRTPDNESNYMDSEDSEDSEDEEEDNDNRPSPDLQSVGENAQFREPPDYFEDDNNNNNNNNNNNSQDDKDKNNNDHEEKYKDMESKLDTDERNDHDLGNQGRGRNMELIENNEVQERVNSILSEIEYNGNTATPIPTSCMPTLQPHFSTSLSSSSISRRAANESRAMSSEEEQSPIENALDEAEEYEIIRAFANEHENTFFNAFRLLTYSSRILDASIVNMRGETPLHILCRDSDHNKYLVDQLSYLLAYCDEWRFVKDKHEQIPLHFAFYNQNSEMMDLLLKPGKKDTSESAHRQLSIVVSNDHGVKASWKWLKHLAQQLLDNMSIEPQTSFDDPIVYPSQKKSKDKLGSTEAEHRTRIRILLDFSFASLLKDGTSFEDNVEGTHNFKRILHLFQTEFEFSAKSRSNRPSQLFASQKENFAAATSDPSSLQMNYSAPNDDEEIDVLNNVI
ncbi:PHD zinc finger-containing protein [Reticulomyxa filosa]|uniref:PHD zinc finger-containing protein n=1 Tax=Reticulomyxa filosa TaxID=46433 RepID=X6NXN2_RETFI|nr:PHD zinc finger-containing protein [Reticulomyxa filosa]|eukprot:ETO30032.1 PHD zinc finger-containing protein [Reticulomyxa filosa]